MMRAEFLMQCTADLTRPEIKVAEAAESFASGAAMNGLLGWAAVNPSPTSRSCHDQ